MQYSNGGALLLFDPYRQIYCLIYNEGGQDDQWTAYMLQSVDGINWDQCYKLWNYVCDTQYSVIVAPDQYYVYHRLWKSVSSDEVLRCIGLTVISPQGGIIRAKNCKEV